MNAFLNLFGDLSEILKAFISWLGRIKDALFGFDEEDLKDLMNCMKDIVKETEPEKISFKRGRLDIEFTYRRDKPNLEVVKEEKEEA